MVLKPGNTKKIKVSKTKKSSFLKKNQTENPLLEIKNKFDLITNEGNDIIAFYTYLPKDKYLYVSPNIRKITGYSAKEALSNNNFFKKKLLGENKDFHTSEKELKRLQKKNIEKNLCFSFKIKHKNKKEIWLENNLVPIKNEKNKIIFFLNILRDITKQKEAEIEIEEQNKGYKNLLDNSPAAYAIHDKGVCIYVNQALVKLFKVKNKDFFIGKSIAEFLKQEDEKRARVRIKKIYNKKNVKPLANYVVTDFYGNPVEVEAKSVLIQFNSRPCVLTQIKSVTERKNIEYEKLKTLVTESINKKLHKEISNRQIIEDALRKKTAHLTSILESSTHMIWTIDAEYKVISFNKNFKNFIKDVHGVEIKPMDKIQNKLKEDNQDYIDFWYPIYKEAFEGKKMELERENISGGRTTYRKIFIDPIYNNKNQVVEITCIANDITESKINEHKLITQTKKLTAILDSSNHYIWTIDRNDRLTSFNKNYFDLVNIMYGTQPYIGLVLNRENLSNDKDYVAIINYHYERAFNGNPTSFEVETRNKENKLVYLEIFLSPIFENNRVVEISGIGHNITEKKLALQKIETSLNEKEVLLKEIHHRVKNNMQIISSILNLQSSYVMDENAITLLQQSQNRIKTMAYIHESLYQSKSFNEINFSKYIQAIIHNIIQSHSYSEDKVKLELDLQDIMLSLDYSIPLGLIINELTTNAFKHAFPGTTKGIIRLSFKCENNSVFLKLEDNGVGLKSNVNFENSPSLGLQLVNTLLEQIDGKLGFKSEKDKGTEITITFKM